MAIPQTAVNFNIPVGIPGEVATDVPVNAVVRLIHSGGVNPNVFGYAYTETTYATPGGTNQTPQSATVGGTGVFAGILLQPKTASSVGGTTGALSTTFNLLEDSYGTLGNQGAFFVSLPAAAAIGDHVVYDNTTGALATIAPAASTPVGKTKIAGARVAYFALSAAGVGIIKITGAN